MNRKTFYLLLEWYGVGGIGKTRFVKEIFNNSTKTKDSD